MLHLMWCSVFFHGIAGENPVIQTKSGPIQGFTLTTYGGKEIDAYFSIPYAKAPLGSLRFKKPEPVEPWSKVLQATKLPPACVRPKKLSILDTPISGEDCLYLIISVPKVRKEKLPVLIKEHGGGYIAGSVASFIGNTTSLAGEENVIVVSPNYRLNVFGFLYLDTPSAPGNIGLWDQNLALKWVKENIETFGGDPNCVTIIGESAGGASVSSHVLSEYSQPYFKRSISLSGIATSFWAALDPEDLKNRSLAFAEKVGCSNSDPEEIVKCLQGIEAEKLVAEFDNLTLDEYLSRGFAPVVDGDFFKDCPKKLVEKGQFNKGDYMLGSATEEGLMFAKLIVGNREITAEDIDKLAERFSPDGDELIKSVIRYLYTNWTDPEKKKNLWDSADKMLGDVYFTCDMTEFATAATEFGSSVYRTVFNEPVGGFPNFLDKHASEALFMYGDFLNKKNPLYSSKYEQLSRRAMRFTANFARTGNPNKNSDGTSLRQKWPKYSEKGHEYLLVTADADIVGYGYRDNFCAFWNKLLPELVKERQ